jgi:glutamate/tyrosine decarboxylase-like PLP-dependent enzyme
MPVSSFQNDLINLSSLLDKIQQLALTHIQNLSTARTSPQTSDIPTANLPEMGQGATFPLHWFTEHYQSLMTASAGPRYLGFVTGGTTPAALAGDWLVSAFDQNTQSIKAGSGDCSALLELEAIRLLRQLLNLPDAFMGGFVTGATMSNFTGLAVARQWFGAEYGLDIATEGLRQDVPVLAATPHSSAVKALAMLGIGRNSLRFVPTLPNREAFDPAELEAAIEELKGEPFILISSGGTVDTVDFDDMAFIADLKKRYRFWWHVDAAFGGFAACSPAYAHLLTGWELADSITIDGHKWLNVPYDSAVILTRTEHAHLQRDTFKNANAPYLGDLLQNFSYLNFVPENSRRFRALPAWFTLMAYGRDGYRALVENSIARAQQLGRLLDESAMFSLAAPVRLNVVCFTLKAGQTNDPATQLNDILIHLKQRGRVFLTPTAYKGIPCLRAAFVNWQTTDADVQIVVDELLTACQAVQPVDL